MFLYTQKDIVLVPFPFTDLQSQKKRPVLIISNNKINGSDVIEDFIGVALTTVLRGTEYSIMVGSGDYMDGKLPDSSEIQCNKIATLCKSLVIKKMCTIKDDKFDHVKEKVLRALGLNKSLIT